MLVGLQVTVDEISQSPARRSETTSRASHPSRSDRLPPFLTDLSQAAIHTLTLQPVCGGNGALSTVSANDSDEKRGLILLLVVLLTAASGAIGLDLGAIHAQSPCRKRP